MRVDEFFQSIAKRPPFTKLHPRVGGFLKDYFAKEKVVAFGDRFVVNTHFPPFPVRLLIVWPSSSPSLAMPPRAAFTP